MNFFIEVQCIFYHYTLFSEINLKPSLILEITRELQPENREKPKSTSFSIRFLFDIFWFFIFICIFWRLFCNYFFLWVGLQKIFDPFKDNATRTVLKAKNFL